MSDPALLSRRKDVTVVVVLYSLISGLFGVFLFLFRVRILKYTKKMAFFVFGLGSLLNFIKTFTEHLVTPARSE